MYLQDQDFMTWTNSTTLPLPQCPTHPTSMPTIQVITPLPTIKTSAWNCVWDKRGIKGWRRRYGMRIQSRSLVREGVGRFVSFPCCHGSFVIDAGSFSRIGFNHQCGWCPPTSFTSDATHNIHVDDRYAFSLFYCYCRISTQFHQSQSTTTAIHSPRRPCSCQSDSKNDVIAAWCITRGSITQHTSMQPRLSPHSPSCCVSSTAMIANNWPT